VTVGGRFGGRRDVSRDVCRDAPDGYEVDRDGTRIPHLTARTMAESNPSRDELGESSGRFAGPLVGRLRQTIAAMKVIQRFTIRAQVGWGGRFGGRRGVIVAAMDSLPDAELACRGGSR
jgi:hypothetical protein